MDLTTDARVRNVKGWGTDVTRDAQLAVIIKAVSASVEKALDRGVEEMERTQYFDVEKDEGQVFRLNSYPVATSPAIAVYNDHLRGFSGSAIDSDDYYLDTASGLLTIDGTALDYGAGALKVVYTGGMGEDAADFIANYPDIAHAVDLQVAFLYEGRNRLGQGNISAPDGSITVLSPHEWLEPLKQAVDAHRRMGGLYG